jgi:hypothetical protein
MKRSFRNFPVHGWVGIGLAIVSWILNWSIPGLRTHFLFFPLWLGYSLAVDALVFMRRGTSLLTRNLHAFAMLFIISIPGWWLFELINLQVQNWHYLGAQYFNVLEYFLLNSLSFSTVMPAVFGTAELVSTFTWIRRIKRGFRIAPTSRTVYTFFFAGFLMLILLLKWPVYFFPFVWISVYFITEPINILLKNRSLTLYTAEGDWRPVLSLGVGCILCGFFWEMWNYYSYPKWVYQIPFVDFLHIFEMPLLGYGGYFPFSLELFALYHLLTGIFKLKMWDYIQISRVE